MRGYEAKLVGLLVIILFASTLLVAPPVAQLYPLQVTVLTGGVRIRWQHVPAARLSDLRPGATPLITIGGMQVPGQLVALRISGDGVSSSTDPGGLDVPWYGELTCRNNHYATLVGGGPRPALAASASGALPTAPVVVLRRSPTAWCARGGASTKPRICRTARAALTITVVHHAGRYMRCPADSVVCSTQLGHSWCRHRQITRHQAWAGRFR
ncbi:MAG: hypothetical protein U0074_05345 [Kouleothrix sp.]